MLGVAQAWLHLALVWPQASSMTGGVAPKVLNVTGPEAALHNEM